MIDDLKHYPIAEDLKYSRIFAGAAWPAERAGFVVVVGECKGEFVLGLPVVRVLDEARELDLWQLVLRLAAFRDYYNPERIVVDGSNVAAMQFLSELPDRGARPEHSMLVEMAGPMGYAMPVLKRMLDVRRLTIPEGLMLQGELYTVPMHEDPASLKLADYLAVASLAFAVLLMEQSRPARGESLPTAVDFGGKVL